MFLAVYTSFINLQQKDSCDLRIKFKYSRQKICLSLVLLFRSAQGRKEPVSSNGSVLEAKLSRGGKIIVALKLWSRGCANYWSRSWVQSYVYFERHNHSQYPLDVCQWALPTVVMPLRSISTPGCAERWAGKSNSFKFKGGTSTLHPTKCRKCRIPVKGSYWR